MITFQIVVSYGFDNTTTYWQTESVQDSGQWSATKGDRSLDWCGQIWTLVEQGLFDS